MTRLQSVRSDVGVLLGPLTSLLNGSVLVLLPVVSHGLVKGVIDVGSRHEGLDGQEHGLDLKGWRPLVLQDVEADTA